MTESSDLTATLIVQFTANINDRGVHYDSGRKIQDERRKLQELGLTYFRQALLAQDFSSTDEFIELYFKDRTEFIETTARFIVSSLLKAPLLEIDSDDEIHVGTFFHLKKYLEDGIPKSLLLSLDSLNQIVMTVSNKRTRFEIKSLQGATNGLTLESITV